MSVGKDEVVELIKTSNDKLLDSCKGLLERTVSQIKRSNEESAENQTKEKLSSTNLTNSRKRQTRTILKFNQKLSETLDSAKSAVENWHLEKVKNDLGEGEKLISERQKHILLADKSDYGWATVVEYKKHSLRLNRA